MGTVVDLGAGDGRFARYGAYERYVGYELDAEKLRVKDLPPNASVVSGCALDVWDYFSAAVGNPPFIRNQDLGVLWRRRAKTVIYKETAEVVNSFSNLYLYFMWLALVRTSADGIVALVVPFDWTYRPSAQSLRAYIARQGWSVNVYRLLGSAMHFPGVKTTPCITLIDKQGSERGMQYWSTPVSLRLSQIAPTDAVGSLIFPYERRAHVYAVRGFSPGSQEVFALTEDARRQAKIRLSSVVPCVTTLRDLPYELTVLNRQTFWRHFVQAGRRCWLLKTHLARLSKPVLRWVNAAPYGVRNSTTCRKRRIWYRFSSQPAPRVLLASGFRTTPRILENRIAARNLGSVFGVFDSRTVARWRDLVEFLKGIDFARGTVPDAHGFRRVEVRQVNALLKRFRASLPN